MEIINQSKKNEVMNFLSTYPMFGMLCAWSAVVVYMMEAVPNVFKFVCLIAGAFIGVFTAYIKFKEAQALWRGKKLNRKSNK